MHDIIYSPSAGKHQEKLKQARVRAYEREAAAIMKTHQSDNNKRLLLTMAEFECLPDEERERILWSDNCHSTDDYEELEPEVISIEEATNQIASDKPEKRKMFYAWTECKEIPPLVWLVKELIPANSDVALYGESGALKSFVALDIALSLRTGLRALGSLEVKHTGPVFYFAGEGFHAMAKKRQLAWCIEKGIEPVDGVWFADGVPLVNDDRQIVETITEMTALTDSASLVVIDTLVRSLNGLDEDKSNSASVYFAKLKRIREALGCTTLTVGHFGKDLARGERGSSSFRANYDAIIWVEKHSKDEPTGVHTVQLWVRKMKDGEDGKRLWLQSKSIALPPEGDDEHRTSLVLVPVSEEEGKNGLASAADIVKQETDKQFADAVEMAIMALSPTGEPIPNADLVNYLTDKDKPFDCSPEEYKKLKDQTRKKLERAGEAGKLTKFIFSNKRWGLPLYERTQTNDKIDDEI
jgi:KaiC/GvpD/RAD55 family RecA-like ATPase